MSHREDPNRLAEVLKENREGKASDEALANIGSMNGKHVGLLLNLPDGFLDLGVKIRTEPTAPAFVKRDGAVELCFSFFVK